MSLESLQRAGVIKRSVRLPVGSVRRPADYETFAVPRWNNWNPPVPQEYMMGEDPDGEFTAEMRFAPIRTRLVPVVVQEAYAHAGKTSRGDFLQAMLDGLSYSQRVYGDPGGFHVNNPRRDRSVKKSDPVAWRF